MTALVFSLSGEPRGKGRPRTAVRGGFARVYTDAATRKYEASVKSAALGLMGERKPFEGALSVSLRFRLPVPKSTTKRLRAAKLSGEEPHFGAYDIDNLAKSILDGCNGAVWGDDKQIVRLFVTKIAAERPGVDIRVEAFAPQSGDA